MLDTINPSGCKKTVVGQPVSQHWAQPTWSNAVYLALGYKGRHKGPGDQGILDIHGSEYLDMDRSQTADFPNSLQQFAKHDWVQSRHAQPIYMGIEGSKVNMGQDPIHCNGRCNLHGIGSMASKMACPRHGRIRKVGSIAMKEGNPVATH